MKIKLKEMRSIKGWTQAEVATHSGISLDYIRSLEIGRASPSLKIAQKLKIAFGCEHIDDLIDEAI
ncbi:hypothetical protein BK133_01025 [Paenibacillus sp. FSL H8-0548]|uniref:helix-turn-helix transcriptional regulator n=1 Tax=Paenibacillus sp. FSL H8-0548 TaxID=1920422 RepID=UPI00096DAB52|nr:helix-turn-helix transcriptional regulator [Paenibacillus sp. FSL H8-0548]OMF38817.1 hypothetical protein BK133_01025 [Paenibacillus sp. FSL H8-0548]